MADTITSTDLPQVHGQVVLNPDGTAIGTPVGGATSANQTNGTQKTQIVDAGGEAVTVTGGKLDVNATASLAGQSIPSTGATEAVTVQVVDGSGNQISSFGGGTQYTEGDTDASITGTAVMFETNTGTNTLGVVNATNPLPVSATIDTTGLATTTTDTNTGTIAGDTTSIDAKIPALGQALAAASVPVVLTAAQVTTLTPPAAITGFGTAANQTTIIGHVDGIETLLGTIDTDTGTIATEVAGLLTDTELRATPVPVSGTVTATATDLDIRNLANTDVVTAELSAVDNAVLDTIAAKDFATQTTLAAMNAKMVTGTDIGDVTINNSTGAAAVNIQDGGNSITVDNGGTFAVQAAATLAAETTKVIGTIRVASGGIASGSLAAGAIAAGATSIATTEDTASAAADHLVKVAQIRLDTPVSGANLSASGDYTQFIADSFGKTWTADNQVEDAAHASGDRGSFMLAVRDDTLGATSGTEGDYEGLHTNANGALWSIDVNSAAMLTSLQLIDDAIAGTEMQVDVVGALPAGTNAIGKLAANSGVDIGDVDVTSIAAGTNLVGDVGIQPRTTNGLDTFMASGSDGSTILVATSQAVKAAAGKVYGYYLYNPEAAVTFVHFYNTASASVTVGTTAPLFTLPIPAGSAANLGITDMGVTFSTAIAVAATTTAGGNTAPATGVTAVIWYK